MKKGLKRLLSLIMAVVMLTGIMAIGMNVFADDGYSQYDYDKHINNANNQLEPHTYGPYDATTGTATCTLCGFVHNCREHGHIDININGNDKCKCDLCGEDAHVDKQPQDHICDKCGQPNTHTWILCVHEEATCRTGDRFVYYCSTCGYSEDGHNHDENGNVLETAYGEGGRLYETIKIIDGFTVALGHYYDFSSDKVDITWTGLDSDSSTPYITATGVFTCARKDCGYQVSVTIENIEETSSGKIELLEEMLDPTCQSGSNQYKATFKVPEGNDTTKYKIYTETKTASYGKLSDHVEDSPIVNVIKNPSCEEPGEKEIIVKCKFCGTVISRTTEEIAAEGHDDPSTATLITVDPTCTEEGRTYYVCSKCHKEVTVSTTPAESHDFDRTNPIQVIPPTATQSGKLVYKCRKCDATVIEDDPNSPATGGTDSKVRAIGNDFYHEVGEWKENESGELEFVKSDLESHVFLYSEDIGMYRCIICGEVKDLEEVKSRHLDKFGQDAIELTGRTKATCESYPTETYRCRHCDGTYYVRIGDQLGHQWPVKRESNGITLKEVDPPEDPGYMDEDDNPVPILPQIKPNFKWVELESVYEMKDGEWQDTSSQAVNPPATDTDDSTSENGEDTSGSTPSSSTPSSSVSTSNLPEGTFAWVVWNKEGNDIVSATLYIRCKRNDCDRNAPLQYTVYTRTNDIGYIRTGVKVTEEQKEELLEQHPELDKTCGDITVNLAMFTIYDFPSKGYAYHYTAVRPTDFKEHTKDKLTFENLENAKLSEDGKSVVGTSCLEDAKYEEVYYCKECGKEISREEKTITAPGKHTPDPDVSKVQVGDPVEPTCTKDGYTTYKYMCKVCGEYYTEKENIIPALGHIESTVQEEEVTKATCEHEGRIRYYTKCPVCNQIVEERYETVPIQPHTWNYDEGEEGTGVPPTCTESGYRYRTCTVCHKQEKVNIPALGHDFRAVPYDPATYKEFYYSNSKYGHFDFKQGNWSDTDYRKYHYNVCTRCYKGTPQSRDAHIDVNYDFNCDDCGFKLEFREHWLHYLIGYPLYWFKTHAFPIIFMVNF